MSYTGEFTDNCPYCDSVCDADFCDVGVGMVQCGPFHCMQCGASQIGPYDDTFDPYRTFWAEPQKPKDRVLTKRESETHWYEPNTPPGPSANVIGGHIVSHQVMKKIYDLKFTNNPQYEDKEYVNEWWKNIREDSQATTR